MYEQNQNNNGLIILCVSLAIVGVVFGVVGWVLPEENHPVWAVSNLTDAAVTNPLNHHYLVYNGSLWINAPITTLDTPLKIGNVENNSGFEADGTLVFNGNASVWNDINFEALMLGKGASAPELIAIFSAGGLQGLGFDGQATSEQLFGGSEILHNYREGSNIYPHMHWCPSTDGQGNVTWFFEYCWQNTDLTFSAPTTLNVSIPAGGAWLHEYSGFPVINGSEINIGAHLMFRLYRDPTIDTDTYGDDAVLLSVGFHYEIDTVGSRSQFTK